MINRFSVLSRALSRYIPIAFLFIILNPAIASAQGKVVLFPLAPIGEGVDESLINDITNSLFGEIDTRKSFTMIEGKEVVAPPQEKAAPAPSTPAAQEAVAASPDGYLQAMQLLSQGETSTQRNRWEAASATLEEAIKLFENNLSFLEDNSKLEGAYLTLSVSYFRRGKEREGRENLRKVLVISPDLTLDARKYPPLFRSIADEIRQEVKSAGLGIIKVTSGASGAKVFLDGREVGTIPAEIPNVIAGTHVLRVVSDNGNWGGLVTAKSGTTITQDVPLSGPSKAQEEQAVATAPGQAQGPFIVKAIKSNSFTADAKAAAISSAAATSGLFVLVGGVAAKDGSLLVPIFICDVKSKKCDRLIQAVLDTDLNALDTEAPRFADALAKKAQEGLKGDITLPAPFISDQADDVAPVVAAPVVVSENPPAKDEPKDTPPAPASEPEPPVEPAADGVSDAASDGATDSAMVANAPQEVTPVGPIIEPPVEVLAPSGDDVLAQNSPVDLDQEAKKSKVKKPFYKTWWFWTITGVVVVGAAAGTTVGVIKGNEKTTKFRMAW